MEMTGFLSVFEKDEVSARFFEQARDAQIAWLTRGRGRKQSQAKATMLQDPSRVLRVKAWFAAVVNVSGVDSPLHLHRLIDLNESIDDLKVYVDDNDRAWHKYKAGRMMPRDKYVVLVDEKYSGTASLFFSVLWLVLREDFSRKHYFEFYSGLSDFEKSILGVRVDCNGDVFGVVEIDTVKNLEGMSTFSSLACLIFLIYLGDEFYNFKFGAEKIAYSILNCLAYMCFEIATLGVAHELCELVFERAVRVGENSDIGFVLDIGRFVYGSVVLNISSLYVCLKEDPELPAKAWEDFGCVGGAFQAVMCGNVHRSRMFKMLHEVSSGLDLALMMRPKYRVKGVKGGKESELSLLVSKRNSIQDEARAVAISGRGKWIPEEAVFIYDFIFY